MASQAVPACPPSQYTGNSTYAIMQSSTYYSTTAGVSVSSWQAALCSTAYAFICEEPAFKYACSIPEAPPDPPASPFCLPTQNDVTYCPDNQTAW
jgi:hypothetical protein